MAYQPIENYGIIGNMKTTALVGKNGSVDWFCYPHFDSPSVFASILDEQKGGYFQIVPNGKYSSKQFYWPETNILITRFFTTDGVAEVIDYMPVSDDAEFDEENSLRRIVRQLRGHIQLKMVCRPRFDYAREKCEISVNKQGATFHGSKWHLELTARVPLEVEDHGVVGIMDMKEGQSTNFMLKGISEDGQCDDDLDNKRAYRAFRTTVKYWHNWLEQCTYKGRWSEIVHRSALTLKLLTFDPTGAIVAAATTSLPEGIGGERNWDYRYTWIRDAAFTVYGLLRIGFTREAASFMKWIEARCAELNPDDSLQIMYGIDGRHELKEEILDHLSGYKDSKPVRIGNGAYDQLQLDIYGELMDAVYLYNKYGSPISYDLWKNLRRLVDWVCEHWDKPDEGIWEVRGGQQHFVYSKLMCWVALDRGIRLADKRSFPAPRDKWIKVRDAIYEEIIEKGWNEERKAFMQSYGGTGLDAANLMMPLVFFLSPSDDRMISTLKETLKSPEEGGLVSSGLVYRYNNNDTDDGLEGEEGTFNICTFWMVEALTRAGKVEKSFLTEARIMFEQMLGYANHLGLYAEETSKTGEALGNFPQAFTHLSLISAAYNLNKALGGRD